jgi:hypothetical protein
MFSPRIMSFREHRKDPAMPKEEIKKQPGRPKPPVPPQSIGKHKSMEMDSLQPTPERTAKTGKR